MRARIITILSFAIGLYSCKKITVERNNSSQDYSIAQIIGQWKITNISSDEAFDWNGDGSKEKDVYGTWTDCNKDNLFEFAPDSVGTYQLECSNKKTGTWSLDGKTIIIIPAGLATLYEQIDSLRSNQIKTVSVLQPRPGEYFRIYKTWSRQ